MFRLKNAVAHLVSKGEFLFVFGVLIFLAAADILSGYESPGMLSFGGWGWMALTAASWAGLLLLPLLLVGRHSRLFYVPYAVLALLICSLQWYMRINFKLNISGEWIGIVLGSSPEEVMYFLKSEMSARAIALSGLLVVSVVVVGRRLWRIHPSCVGRWKYVVSAVAIGVFLIMNPAAIRNPLGVLKTSPSFFFVLDTIQQFMRRDRLEEPVLPPDLRYDVTNGTNPVVVFVLGESATRNRWSLYGYIKPTTPRMEALGESVVSFSDCIAASANTVDSMRLLLTNATLERPNDVNCTLVQMLKHVGYRNVLFSSQSRWGRYFNTEAGIFHGCEYEKFSSEEKKDGLIYDDRLLCYLDGELARLSQRPTAVFLHLSGSHTPFYSLYPHDSCPFQPESANTPAEARSIKSMPNHYDNTIAFTDKVLDGIVKRLERLDRPTLMFYVSDHGESVESDAWRNAADINVWEVPMICWFSDSYAKRFPRTIKGLRSARDRKLQMDVLLPGLLELFQVSGGKSLGESFLGQEFHEGDRFIRNGRVKYGKVD